MINVNEFMKGKRRKPTVCFPNNIANENMPLWGYYHEESNFYNIVDTKKPSKEMGGSESILLGHFYANQNDTNSLDDKIIGYYDNENIVF